MHIRHLQIRSLEVVLASGLLLIGAGCTHQQASTEPTSTPIQNQPMPRNDQQIASDIQSRIGGESALNGQGIQVSVTNGTATLNGTVDNDASRALASNDAGAIDGVKTVLNNLSVSPPKPARVASAPPATASPKRNTERRTREVRGDQTAQSNNPPAVQSPAAPEYQNPVRGVQTATPPPPPAPPAKKTVTIATGTTIPVRLTDALDSATAQTGQTFRGTLASDILSEGMVAIPRGTVVSGRVIDAKDATHFSGSAALSIELTSLSLTNGRQVPVVTTAYAQQGKGRGKNTAVKAGGGAALGAIIGALAGGGKGAAIGAASGGGIGAGVNAVTRGQQIKLPAESLINFTLQSPVNVTSGQTAPAARTYTDSESPQLQPR